MAQLNAWANELIAGLLSPYLILATLAVFGVARAFLAPSSSSLVVSLVPTEDFANAVTWNSSAWQAATIVGPVAGGILYGLGVTLDSAPQPSATTRSEP